MKKNLFSLELNDVYSVTYKQPQLATKQDIS